MYYVYLLKLNHKIKKFYIGSTPNLKRRINQHKHGRVFFTKSKLPIKLFYFEAYAKENLAKVREKRLKRNGSSYVGLLKRLKLK